MSPFQYHGSINDGRRSCYVYHIRLKKKIYSRKKVMHANEKKEAIRTNNIYSESRIDLRRRDSFSGVVTLSTLFLSSSEKESSL